MPTESPALIVARPSAAARAAEGCWAGNHRALSGRQPGQAAALADCKPDVTWTTARDGSRWARDAAGRWAAGCSVPLLAGRALLRTLAAEPGGHVLLAPAHGGLVVAARERLGPDTVLFVVQPDLTACRLLLACCDVSADVAAGRTWVLAGDGWADSLRDALDRNAGLGLPARFVRTRLTPDAVVDPLVQAAQAVIADVATRRAADLDGHARSPRPVDGGRAVLIARSRFGLWTADADVLRRAAVAAGLEAVVYDPGDPLAASPLALARAAEGCGRILAVDRVRDETAAVLPPGSTWVTWVTKTPVPAPPAGSQGDHLIVADPTWRALAMRSGWSADRVHVGSCPPRAVVVAPPSTAVLGLLADTTTIVAPEGLRDFSSQLLLWDDVAAELHDDPFALRSVEGYLADRAGRFNVDPRQLDADLFARQLIGPAYVQGLARLLISHGLPIRLWGSGWAELDEFRSHAAGPLACQAEVDAAVAASTAVIRPVPGTAWHPVDACGRPTLAGGPGFLTRAAAALRAPRPTDVPHAPDVADAMAATLKRR